MSSSTSLEKNIPLKTTSPSENWIACSAPAAEDIIRWREPVWDVPSKPRGKPDKIGEQMVTAKLIVIGEPTELQVIEVERLSLVAGAADVPSKIKNGDMIRRKMSSITGGDCQKLSQES
jgi:hypothetical protein